MMRCVLLWLAVLVGTVQAKESSNSEVLWAAFSKGQVIPVEQLQRIRLAGPAGTEIPVLCHAALNNDHVVIDALLQAGVSPDQVLSEDDHQDWLSEIQCVAVFYGENGNDLSGSLIDIKPETLQKLLKKTKFSRLRLSEQYLLFELAMLNDDVNLARALISQGFPVNWRDEFNNTLLVHSLWSQAYQVSEVLLDAGAVPESRSVRAVGADADPGRLIQHALLDNADNPDKSELLSRLQRKINQNKM